jgi:hypothetical protein
MAKRNIAKGLIKQPIDLRSQKARRKNSGQPIGNIIGDPLAAGYFSNGDPNRDVEGGGLINHPGQAQPYPGNTFTDESYQPPAFNQCPVGYTQNPGATGDYDDPYCIPSTNMPGGEWTGGNAYDPGGFGMAVDPSGFDFGPGWFGNPALNEGIEYTWMDPTDPSTQPDEEEEEIAIAACQDQGLSYNSNWGGDGIGIGCFDGEALLQWAGTNGYISSGNWLNNTYAFCHWQGLSVDVGSGNCCDEEAGLCP